MRLNLLAAFIISTFLCSKILDAISLFTPQKFYWIYIIPAVFLLLAALYKKADFLKSKISLIFLTLFTSIPYLFFVLYVFVCIINYPPEGTLEAKLIPEAVTEQEISAGNHLDNLLKDFENKIGTEERELISKFEVNDSNKMKIIELLDKTNVDRKEIFEYISKNSIAIPNTFDVTSKYYFLSETDNYESNLPILVSIFKLELLEVEMLKREQKYDEAVDKYITLWHKAADAYKLKNTYIFDVLCLIAVTQNLGDYFYNNQRTFVSYDLTEVARLKEDIINNMDRIYSNGFANEYTMLKTKLENSKNIWPLMDRNKQLRKLDEIYYSMVEFEKNPLSNSSFEEPLDFSSVKLIDFFKGYIGEVIYSVNANMFNGLSANTVKKKNELSVYFYAMDKNNYQNIPNDYFTGEKFEVTDYPDRLEINVHTNISLDSPKKYVVIK